jgi:hypothetical protein
VKFFSSAAYPVADVAVASAQARRRRRESRGIVAVLSVYCDAILIAALKIALYCVALAAAAVAAEEKEQHFGVCGGGSETNQYLILNRSAVFPSRDLKIGQHRWTRGVCNVCSR